jgi:hypothetical protein
VAVDPTWGLHLTRIKLTGHQRFPCDWENVDLHGEVVDPAATLRPVGWTVHEVEEASVEGERGVEVARQKG